MATPNHDHKPYHINITGSILASKITPEIQAFYMSDAVKTTLERLKKTRNPCTLGQFPSYIRFTEKNQ